MRKPPPALLFFTDPVRTPDPAAAAQTLPRGSAIVYRHFGAPNREDQARALLRIARDRGLTLLIGADAALAVRVGADGVHVPERLAHRAGPLKRAHPGWLVTAAAHSARARAAAGPDAVVLSVALPSRSPSAGRALGPVRLAGLARAKGPPVYALGGLTDRTAARVIGSDVVGLAAVEGLAS